MTSHEHSQLEITARDLTIAYGDYIALKIPELAVRGKVIAIIGHNGSGKSTFLKSMLRLLPPRTGELGIRLWRTPSESEAMVPERHMAFSPENGAVFADISVESYIRLWCRIKHGDGKYYQKAGSEFIERLAITPLLKRKGRELSKGQRRRVQIAVGFLTRPQVFLFDEPFDGLDIQQAGDLATIMLDAAKDMSLLVSSHRMDVVERLADVVLVLKDGNVLAHGSVASVCEALCEQSITVTIAESAGIHLGELVAALRREFTSSLIHLIGSQLIITGQKIDRRSLGLLFSSHNVREFRVDQSRPSLIDAMNYHLRHLALRAA